jgi:hypothetical protein
LFFIEKIITINGYPGFFLKLKENIYFNLIKMKAKLIRRTTYALLVLFLNSCQFNNQYLNREDDKAEAELVTTKFYSFIMNQEFEKTLGLFSDKFFEYASKEELLKLLTAIENKLGKLENTRIEKWDTRIINGSDPSSAYKFLYIVKYEKYEAAESISLIKEDDGTIRIAGYNVDSKGLME